MDADISDILASVSAPTLPQQTLDHQTLTRAWINERTSPTLLPYPTSLIQRLSASIAAQISKIEDMTASASDSTTNFTLVILQTELERVKFLLRSYVRCRIAKIDRFPVHYQQLARARADDAPQQDAGEPILSALEAQYVAAHQALLASHYAGAFLKQFPAALQRLDDTGGGVSMVDVPDEDGAVFCRVLRDCVVEREVYGNVETRRGDVWILRYRTIKDQVGRGDVELI